MSSPPNVSIRENSEQLGSDSVNLIVEWTWENNHLPFYHDINIVPQGATTRFIDDRSIDLIMPYNVSFNVSLTIRLCCRTLASTIFTIPVYTKTLLFCDTPVLQPNVQTMYTESSQLLIEGTTLNFTCLPGLTLSGPDTTICFGNGYWIPNPDLVKCKGLQHYII